MYAPPHVPQTVFADAEDDEDGEGDEDESDDEFDIRTVKSEDDE